MSQDRETEVLIVGGGPVGLFLAADLAQRGIKSVIIEKRSNVPDSPRALVVNSRTMEHMRQLGLQHVFQESSYPRDQPGSITVGASLLRGRPTVELRFSSWGEAMDGVGTTKMFFGFDPSLTVCPALFCPQFVQEAILAKHLKKCTQNSIMWSTEAVSLTQDENGATLRVRSMMDGSERELRAKFVVGCDGGKSFVRKTIGVHTFGKFVLFRGCTTFFKSPELAKRLREKNRFGLSYNLGRKHQVVIAALTANGDFASHIFVPKTTSDAQMEALCSNAKELILSAIGEAVPLTTQSPCRYNMHGLLSTKYREGCVFLAGDSAHQWLPAGGLGLNIGYSDAADLGWKLAATIDGWGGPYLLDSYELERRGIADNTRRFAMQYGAFIFGPVVINMICLLSMVPLMNRVVNALAAKNSQRQMVENSKVILGYTYPRSNVIVHETDPADPSVILMPEYDSKQFIPSSLPGCRAPHVVLPSCPTILDLFGKSFVLLAIGGPSGEMDCIALQEEMKHRKVPLVVHAFPKLPEIVQFYDRKYFLVRPDGMIAWRSDYQPSRLEAQMIVDTICGHESAIHVLAEESTLHTANDAPNFSFLLDVAIGAWASLIATKKAQLSLRATVGCGLVVASLCSIIRGVSRSHPPPFMQKISRHKAWVVSKSGPASLSLKLEPRQVSDFGPGDVLISVRAASVNSVDMLMRSFSHCFSRSCVPLVLGRGCSGVVVARGDLVHDFIEGDEIYAAIPLDRQGSHAQYVAVPQEAVQLKPDSVDHCKAASLPWVAVTVWQALVIQAGLNSNNTRGKRVLVHCGAGGVGSFAIQLLKAWGAEVSTTCSGENIAYVQSLGADLAFNYQSGRFSEVLQKHSYDVVLDTVGFHYERPSLKLLKLYAGGRYVSLESPAFLWSAKLGPFLGALAFQWYYRVKIICNRVLGGHGFHYSFAQPSGAVLREVSELVDKGAIQPQLDITYPFEEMVAAHQRTEEGHSRGNVVIKVI